MKAICETVVYLSAYFWEILLCASLAAAAVIRIRQVGSQPKRSINHYPLQEMIMSEDRFDENDVPKDSSYWERGAAGKPTASFRTKWKENCKDTPWVAENPGVVILLATVGIFLFFFGGYKLISYARVSWLAGAPARAALRAARMAEEAAKAAEAARIFNSMTPAQKMIMEGVNQAGRSAKAANVAANSAAIRATLMPIVARRM